jgi:hypothetical protein
MHVLPEMYPTPPDDWSLEFGSHLEWNMHGEIRARVGFGVRVKRLANKCSQVGLYIIGYQDHFIEQWDQARECWNGEAGVLTGLTGGCGGAP